MKVCVLIPTYNESKAIGLLVRKIKAKGLDIVVVDDGSIDQTAEIAEESGAEVLRNGENKGKGAALKTGFQYILDKDYDAVITMDGDAQHSPEDIPKLIDVGRNSDAAIIVGNRLYSSENMPFIRWLTNNLMSFLISIICWRNIADSQCGFRLIKKDALKVFNLISDNYEIESEALIAAAHKGFQIKSVPVETIYDKQVSQINPIVDTVRFFKLLLRVFLPFLFNK